MNLSTLLKSISRREWVVVGCITLGVILITGAPFLYGYLSRPAGAVFTGLHHMAPGDTNVFLSMIEQVKQGDNVFINLYTSEPQARLLVNPLWLSVGLLAKWFHLGNLLALHVARSFWIAAFIGVLYVFLAYFFNSEKRRRWALVLVLFASGVGVFLNPFLFDVHNIYEHPTDIWVSESITFLTLLHSPHLIASLTLIVLAFLLMLLAFDTDRLRYSVGAGITCFFLFWFHPFNAPTIYVVLGTYLVLLWLSQRRIVWSQLKHYLALAAIPIPSVLYLYLIERSDWVIRNWSAQNILPSPSVPMYLYGYGFILLFALVGVYRALRTPTKTNLFLLAWAIASAALVYAPVAFQRRMSEGLHIPLALLAFIGIAQCIEWLRRRQAASLGVHAFLMFLVIFLPLTNIQILGQDFYLFNSKKTLPYYLNDGEVAGMRWLREHLDKREVVFSSYYMGNYIPAYSGRIVWIGHGPQTIDLPDKFTKQEWFWRSDDELAAKEALLRNGNVSYLWYGRKEKELGTFDPATKPFLALAFRNNDVSIYRLEAR